MSVMVIDMRIKWVLLTLSLTACVPAIDVSGDSNIFVVGDSNCYEQYSWADLAGFNRDCMWGRQTVHIGRLPKDTNVIFALGTNDSLYGVPIETTRSQVEYLFSGTNSSITCLLPDGDNPVYTDVRDVLIELCPITLEPREMGFLFRHPDGIHGIQSDHDALSISISDYFN